MEVSLEQQNLLQKHNKVSELLNWFYFFKENYIFNIYFWSFFLLICFFYFFLFSCLWLLMHFKNYVFYFGFFFNLSFFSSKFMSLWGFFFFLHIYYVFVLFFFLLIKTLKPLFTNACLHLWIRLCGTTKDEFMINIIHLHI